MALLTATGNQSSILGFGAQVNLDGFTLVRTRGEFVAQLRSASAIANGFSGAFGIGIVTDAAFAVGVTAVPTPVTEADSDSWLYHRFFSCIAGAPIAGAAMQDEDAVNPTGAAVRFEVDSKAMRKTGEKESTIYAAIEVTELGTAAIDIMFNSRLLFKLP